MNQPQTASQLIESYRREELSLDELLAAFKALPMRLPRSMRPGRTWSDVYREAEEGDDGDIPSAVTGAKLIGLITEEVEEQILRIYRRKVERNR